MTYAPMTPELAVTDLALAESYYCEKLGFEVAWRNAPGEIVGLSCGECAIFLRQSENASRGTFWIFVDAVDSVFEELKKRGARIVEPIEAKPWGLRQFLVEDLTGNHLIFFRD